MGNFLATILRAFLGGLFVAEEELLADAVALVVDAVVVVGTGFDSGTPSCSCNRNRNKNKQTNKTSTATETKKNSTG
jgi:hypothetical protein